MLQECRLFVVILVHRLSFLSQHETIIASYSIFRIKLYLSIYKSTRIRFINIYIRQQHGYTRRGDNYHK
jgi:hypothetical protein